MSWLTMNAGADDGRMPAKVSESVLAMVTAGLAKLVELVNHVGAADPGGDGERDHGCSTAWTQPWMTSNRPTVATTSDSQARVMTACGWRLDRRELEHHVRRGSGSGAGAGDLGGDVEAGVTGRDRAETIDRRA